MASLAHSQSTDELSASDLAYTIKYRTPNQAYGLRRTTSSPNLAKRYKSKFGATAHRVHDVWTDYWWERRYYGGERFWPHYGFPYKRFWHEKPRISTLANYPSLSWTSRFSQYDKLDPKSWRRYREPYHPFQRWGPYSDKRFEIRMSVFDARAKGFADSSTYSLKAYQPRIWFPNPSCWPYSYHFIR